MANSLTCRIIIIKVILSFYLNVKAYHIAANYYRPIEMDGVAKALLILFNDEFVPFQQSNPT